MASETQIQTQLDGLAQRQRRLGFWCKLAGVWAAAALLGWVALFFEKQTGWTSSLVLPFVACFGLGAALVVVLRTRKETSNWRELALRIETLHPELQGRLITALQQQAGAGGQLNYLQQRLITEALEYGHRTDWVDVIPASRLKLAAAIHWAALALLGVILIHLRGTGGHQLFSYTPTQEISVTPGDVSLERGSSLVILARFKGMLPSKVDLAFGQPLLLQRVALLKSLGDPMFGGSVPEVASNFVYHIEYGGQRTRDFNVTVYEHPRLERADIDVNFPAYTRLPHKRIENTRRLSAVEGSQVDLALQFNKPVSSARLVARDKSSNSIPLVIDEGHPSASLKQLQLDSSRTYDLQLVDSEGRTNKAPAEFVFEALKNRSPEMRLTSPPGDLRPSPLQEIPFEGTVWDDFGIQAFGIAYAINGQEPKFIELGTNVSAMEKKPFHHLLRLEEIGVRPDELVSWFIWADDLGPDGQSRRTMSDLYFGEVRPFEEVFRQGQGMEGQPGGGESGGQDKTGELADLQKQIVNATWKLHRGKAASAERNSKVRESKVPLHQDSARPDDQSLNSETPIVPSTKRARASIRRSFVVGQVAQSDTSEPVVSPSRAPNRSRQTASQKPTGTQAATYEEDAEVVLESQAQALEKAKEALQKQRDPQTAELWQKAITEMEAAIARLQKATNSPAALKEALAAEEAAYQALIRLQAHEYQVSRSRNSNQSGTSRNQQMQRQLEELELSDSENRYENQREAQRAQNPARREQLQIMSRLQELARRQQDLNQRLKELQSALQEARNERERDELRRQLKRLQEEEQQMLADVDELRQKMDRPENQSQLADERRQLDQTRQEVQKAAESAAQGSASQALAAGTRAQTQLQELRDEMRKKNSSQFGEDLRQMRNQARELARNQEQILKKIQDSNSTEKKSLSNSADQEETRAQLARQKELMTNIVERATQISQQAEEAEPLLSRQLEDTVRKFTQDTAKDLKEAESELLNHGPMTRSLFDMLRDNSTQGAAKLEDITSEMLRLGYLPQAGRLGERARPGIENLKKGVERAAETVLGDDTESLRLAQRQLDDLAGQLGREIAEGQGTPFQTNRAGSTNDSTAKQRSAAAGLSSTNGASTAQASSQKSNQPGQEPGQEQREGRPAGKESEQASSSAKGEGQADAQAAGTETSQSDNASPQPGDSPGRGSLASQGKGLPRSSPGRPTQPGTQGGGQNGGEPGEADLAGGGARTGNWERLLSENARRQDAPITGEDFTSWSDSLREVEELIDEPDLRDDVAKARERARLARQDFKRERKKPDWAVVQLQVMKPLTEVRDRIGEELARRESREALVPLDRDPVPNRYSDLVRRYYQELGKDK